MFSVLAQIFEPQAINARLMLDRDRLVHHHAGRHAGFSRAHYCRPMVGETFFGNRYLMDYELMGGNARDAIVAEVGQAKA